MKQIFNVLENYNIPLYEEDKVRQLLDDIHFQNNNLKTEVNICKSRHSASFETYSTYLSTVISRLFSATQLSPGRYGRRRQVNSSGREVIEGIFRIFEGRRGCGRGGLGGHRGRGKENRNRSLNGVDIRITTRWYGKE